ncbi:uncharacterized protein LDX57_008363 [Aspergillus melleus]|uniref:uncharacterized protein n=1 Tax=Aspergillus melleus TaxID=138277 RepID=UPI001E8D23C5|nr:uncharacterized protein LDX57_008363 [Aspergillus melleus]KAH8430701.1 hypothetical protein LDX57_008363 [Aspergillus melleus]
MGSCGLNLHHHCARVVIVEATRNLNTVWQAGVRAHRVGQRLRKKMWILYQQQTIETYLEWNNAKRAIPQIAGKFQNVVQPLINAAFGEEMKNLDNTSDTIAAAAVKVITEERVLEEAAAQLLRDMLGQTTSRLMFSGHTRDSCNPRVGLFTPVTRRKPRKPRVSKRKRAEDDSDTNADATPVGSIQAFQLEPVWKVRSGRSPTRCQQA